MVILVLLIVMVCSIVLHSVIEKKADSETWELLFDVTWRVSGVIAALMLVIALITYSASLWNLSDMENFYEQNNKVFSKAVANFPDAARVETSTDTTQIFTLSYDYTKEVLDYNKDLNWYKKYQKHWFIGIFVSKAPDNLKFIKIE